MSPASKLLPATNGRARLIEYFAGDEHATNELTISKQMLWFRSLLGKVPRGANLLMSGDPGVGKSTLALQLAAAVAGQGQRVLYIATEQRAESVCQRLVQLCSSARAMKHLDVKDDLYDVSLLPHLLTHRLLKPGPSSPAADLVVIDSLQGGSGLNSQDKRVWSAVLEYLRMASNAGITTLALAHMTKGRVIAGPRTLEHACDATLLLRHAAACRAMIVAKNRFGSAQLEPFALTINPQSTRLEPSPIGASATATVCTIGPGGVVEIEVAITPVRGDRGFVKSPGLSRNEVETVVDLVERTIPDAKSLWALGVTVRAPDGVPHRRDYNLAVAVALIAALRRASVPMGTVLIGDLGLRGELRPPGAATLAAIDECHAAGALETVNNVVVSSETGRDALDALPARCSQLSHLKDAISLLEEHNG